MSATNVQLVRLQKGNVKVEILGKPGMVTKFRDGKCALKDAVIDETVFSNSSKGEIASDADMAAFGCKGRELVELIMKQGKYSLTAAEKREIVEKRHLEVVNFIHDNFIDSTTKTPHPVVRIENALKEVKATIDPDHDAEHNARALIPKLQRVIRLTESTIEGQIVIPNNKLGQCVGLVYNMCKVGKEEYGAENAYFNVTIAPGHFDALNEQLSRASGGLAVFKIAGAAASTEKSGEAEKTAIKKKPGKGGKGKK